MWVPKWYFEAQARRVNGLEKRIAALEEEQQQIRKLVKENIESNEELIGIVKQIYNELAGSETINTDGLKLPSHTH